MLELFLQFIDNFADEDCVIWSKAPKQTVKWTFSGDG